MAARRVSRTCAKHARDGMCNKVGKAHVPAAYAPYASSSSELHRFDMRTCVLMLARDTNSHLPPCPPWTVYIGLGLLAACNVTRLKHDTMMKRRVQ